jgi:lysozyme family protein
MGDEFINQLSADNVYDFAVNSGVSRAVKYAQRIVGAVEDGVMGAKTIRAINGNVEGFVTKYKANRLTFLAKIIDRDSTQEIFRNGWMNRVRNA